MPCSQCGVRNAKARYKRCARCRGAEFDLCACGSQKTKRALMCRPCRIANPLLGEDHPAWKGGRVEIDPGYIRVYAPAHPRAVNGRYVLEHILAMERALGRYLYEDERVHHKNRDPGDNRIENLELWCIGHPSGARVEDALAWAHELIRRYEKENT